MFCLYIEYPYPFFPNCIIPFKVILLNEYKIQFISQVKYR